MKETRLSMILTKFFRFFLFYVPYRSYQYYKESPTPKFSTFILLLFLLSSHIFSLLLLFSQFFVRDFSILSNNRAYNKFIMIPLCLLPFILVMLLFYKLNRSRIRMTFLEFEQSEDVIQNVRNKYYWIYISLSIVFFFASITSPLWLKRS